MKYVCTLRRFALLLGSTGLLLQTGCTTTQFFDFLNTVFLGVTAAGSVAILQNI